MFMKKLFFALLYFCILLGTSCEKIEQPQLYPLIETVHITANLNQDTILKQGVKYHFTEGITIGSGVTLTIEPGCILSFEEYGRIILPDLSASSIIAEGTSENPIRITFNNMFNNEPGINAGSGTTATFEFCSVVSGSFLKFSNPNTSITNCTFEDCSLAINSLEPFKDFSNNSFIASKNDNNFYIALQIYSQSLSSLGSGNAYDSSYGISVLDSDNTYSEEWPFQETAYIFYNSIQVNNLTIAAGQTLKFRGTELIIDGILIANGTATHPISFLSYSESSYWEGISFSYANHQGSILDYCIIDKGGAGYYSKGNLNFQGGSTADGITVQNCTLSNSEQYGIYLRSSGTLPDLINNTFINNPYGDQNW